MRLSEQKILQKNGRREERDHFLIKRPGDPQRGSAFRGQAEFTALALQPAVGGEKPQGDPQIPAVGAGVLDDSIHPGPGSAVEHFEDAPIQQRLRHGTITIPAR